jgi:hypothetical protein
MLTSSSMIGLPHNVGFVHVFLEKKMCAYGLGGQSLYSPPPAPLQARAFKQKNITRITGKANPVHSWRGPEGSRRLRMSEFLHNRHSKVERSTALRTGRLYPQKVYMVLISAKSGAPVRPQGLSTKNSSDTIGFEPATFRLVVQCLDRTTACPYYSYCHFEFNKSHVTATCEPSPLNKHVTQIIHKSMFSFSSKI